MEEHTENVQWGWIYILTSEANYRRYKIGMTRGSPVRRYKQLRTSDPVLELVGAFLIPCAIGSLSQFEKALHQEFGEAIPFADGTLSDWFYGDLEDAVMIVESKLVEWLEMPISSTIRPGVIYRGYGSDFEDHLRFWPEFRTNSSGTL